MHQSTSLEPVHSSSCLVCAGEFPALSAIAVRDRRILFTSHLYHSAFRAWQHHPKHLNPPLHESVKSKTHTGSNGRGNKASAHIQWWTPFSSFFIVASLLFCNKYEGREPGERQGEEKLKKKKFNGVEKTAHVGRGSGAEMFPLVLIACLPWNFFDNHIYSRRGISEKTWWRLKRRNSRPFDTGEEMQLHGSRDIQNIVIGKNHTFY